MALQMIKKLGEEYLTQKAQGAGQGAVAGKIANEAKEASLEELINYANQGDIKCFMCKGYLDEVAKGEKLSSAGEYHLRACLSAQRNLREKSDASLFEE